MVNLKLVVQHIKQFGTKHIQYIFILLFIICYRAVISSSEIVFLGDLISEVGFVALGNSFRLSSAGGVFLCFNLDL